MLVVDADDPASPTVLLLPSIFTDPPQQHKTWHLDAFADQYRQILEKLQMAECLENADLFAETAEHKHKQGNDDSGVFARLFFTAVNNLIDSLDMDREILKEEKIAAEDAARETEMRLSAQAVTTDQQRVIVRDLETQLVTLRSETSEQTRRWQRQLSEQADRYEDVIEEMSAQRLEVVEELEIVEQEKVDLQRQVLNIQRRLMETVQDGQTVAEEARVLKERLEEVERQRMIGLDLRDMGPPSPSLTEGASHVSSSPDDIREESLDSILDLMDHDAANAVVVVEMDNTGHRRFSQRLSMRSNSLSDLPILSSTRSKSSSISAGPVIGEPPTPIPPPPANVDAVPHKCVFYEDVAWLQIANLQLIDMLQQANHELNRKLSQIGELRAKAAKMERERGDLDRRLLAATAARKRWFSFR